MIAVSAEIDRNTMAAWRTLSRQFPTEARRAWNGATLRMKNTLAKTIGVRGGRSGVTAWARTNPITQQLTGRQLAGNKIADPRVIVRYKVGDSQFIGWPSRVEKYATAIQTEEHRPFSRNERLRFYARMRQRGMSSRNIREMLRTVYSRPSRDTVEPFMVHEFPTLGPDLMKRTERAIAKTLKS